MSLRMSWIELCGSPVYAGRWIALDKCRYDAVTRQPLEGDVVDVDDELAELCSRMREAGRTSCAILFCEQEAAVSSRRPPSSPPLRASCSR